MKQYTTANHLTHTIHQLEHILADETFPAIQAAELMRATLLEIMPLLPEAEQRQITEIVTPYDECAEKQYGILSRQKSPEPVSLTCIVSGRIQSCPTGLL